MPIKNKAVWEAESRKHDEAQGYIRDRIICMLQLNPAMGYQQIEISIDNWCSYGTIWRWLVSHETYFKYVERVLPLLSSIQMEKHVEFSKKVRNNWNLNRRGKYLWVHYDEKWFYGFLQRSTAKMCEQLGIEKKVYAIYHKNHIEKVMLVAVTGYEFNGDIDEGGDGLKLGIYRVQVARVAQKMQRAASRNNDGKLKYGGEILRLKGDCYMVDSTVTGSNEGTSNEPKFSLKSLFLRTLFPKIKELVSKKDSKYYGYTPIIQGDNAGLHQDSEYLRTCETYCKKNKWHWEPQAAQMPYMNNLDLAVFPSMSRRHMELLRQNSTSVAKTDEIWQAAITVWKQMESATIARGFVLAYRVAAKVIENKGRNKFLLDNLFHSSVRSDFYNTDEGIRKKMTK